MTRFSIARTLAAAALATVGLLTIAAPAQAQLVPCGVLDPCEPPPTPPQPVNPGPTFPTHFTIQVEEQEDGDRGDEVPFGSPVTITGQLSRPNQDPFQSHVVRLVASTWPYTSEQVISSTRTTGFSYRFVDTPQLNTRYRVIDENGETTNSVQVLAFARIKSFRVKVRRNFRVRMSFRIAFPTEFAFPLGGRKVSWYIERRRKVLQIASSRTRFRNGIMRARVRARVPRGNYRFVGAFCVEQPVGVDTGLGTPVRRRCP